MAASSAVPRPQNLASPDVPLANSRAPQARDHQNVGVDNLEDLSDGESRAPVDIADIFRSAGPAYLAQKSQHLSREQRNAIRDITRCRTPALGGRVQQCENCGGVRFLYNSCGNRHCPKCGTLKKVGWLEARQADILRVQYFHVVFTLPAQIAPIALQNPKVAYDLLFRTVARTLMDVAAKPERLGAELGFVAILHTWGQTLQHHPHVHCLVPGGGLSPQGDRWVACREDFFLPVLVLSAHFRTLFLDGLVEARDTGQLEFVGSLRHLAETGQFNSLIAKARAIDWVVYAKPPLGRPEDVLDYLGRYTHRVAITSQRILSYEDGVVTFTFKDYRDGGKRKEMSLEAHEFIRRFLMHVLPKRFTKCRHYGFLANRTRHVKLPLCRQLLGNQPPDQVPTPRDPHEVLAQLIGHPLELCPDCAEGTLVTLLEFPPTANPLNYLFLACLLYLAPCEDTS